MKGTVRGVLALLTIALGCTGERSLDEIEWGSSAGALNIGDLTIAQPVTAGETAIFLRLWNSGEEVDTLTEVDLAGFGRVSLHQTTIDDGISRMEPEASVVIGPGELVALEPGGVHAMVEGLPGALVLGDSIFIRLQFARSGMAFAYARVRSYEEISDLFDPGE